MEEGGDACRGWKGERYRCKSSGGFEEVIVRRSLLSPVSSLTKIVVVSSAAESMERIEASEQLLERMMYEALGVEEREEEAARLQGLECRM